MNRLIERCAMLDVHKSQITACVRVPDDAGGRRQEIREFRTTTAGLITLADWLRSCGGDGGRDGVHRRLLAARCSTCLRTSSSAGCSTPAILRHVALV